MISARRVELDTILVTGCPRSGTTAVGDILAAMPGAQYLYEPMNAVTGDRRIRTFFEFPGPETRSEAAFDAFVSDVRRLDLDLKPGISRRDSRKMKALKKFTGGRSRVSLLRCRLTPGLNTLIWKDPFASLTTEAVASRHAIPVIATCRSVYATAASFKRLGWGFNLLNMHDRLVAAGREPALPRERLDLDDGALNGAALWALLYSDILKSASLSPDRIMVARTDEIIASPLEAYGSLFGWLGRSLEEPVRNKIAAVYQPRSRAPDMPSDRAHDRNRDLSKVATYWQSLLSPGEVDDIRRLLENTEVIELFDSVPSLLAPPSGKWSAMSAAED